MCSELAPAGLRDDASAFDLSIALDVLVATGQVKPDQIADLAVIGELALDGAVRPVRSPPESVSRETFRTSQIFETPSSSGRSPTEGRVMAGVSTPEMADAVSNAGGLTAVRGRLS